jgi:hypothetical protein
MREAKLLGAAQNPSSEAFANNMNRLQDMVNQWQTEGLKLWLDHDLEIGPLVAGQSLYTFGPGGTIDMVKPLRVLQGYYLQSDGATRRPLLVLSREEYFRLSTVTQTGSINSYYVDKQQLTLNVYLWLTPDAEAATGEAHGIFQQQVDHLITLNQQMTFPVEWYLALMWGLADEICGGQPQAIMDRCSKKATQYKQALEDWDVEDASTRFAPDQRVLYQTSSFR